MADDTNQEEQSNTTTETNQTVDIDKLVQAKVEEQLKDIKGKLDKAYGTRDETLKRLAEYEQREKEAELKRLQEEGKHKEAFELQLAEAKAQTEALQKRNVELTRDIDVRNALGSLDFRNESATEMAFREIVGQLVQNDTGSWSTRSGMSIKDFARTFSENPENEFLFKPKTSSGGGSSPTKPTSESNKPLLSMSQEEILKLAAEGKLPRRS